MLGEVEEGGAGDDEHAVGGDYLDYGLDVGEKGLDVLLRAVQNDFLGLDVDQTGAVADRYGGLLLVARQHPHEDLGAF